MNWVSDYCQPWDPMRESKAEEVCREIQAALDLAKRKKERAIMGRLYRALERLKELRRIE